MRSPPNSWAINVRAYKLFVFVFGAALAGLAGAFNAHFTFFISPGEYGFERGVEILAMGVLGGTGSPWGAVTRRAIMITTPARAVARFRSLPADRQWNDFDCYHSLFAQGSLVPCRLGAPFDAAGTLTHVVARSRFR